MSTVKTRLKASFRYYRPDAGFSMSVCCDCGERETWRAVRKNHGGTDRDINCTVGLAKGFAREDGWRPIDGRASTWVCPRCATARGLHQGDQGIEVRA